MEMRPLRELCETYSGGTPSRGHAEYFGGNIPWVKSGEVVGFVTTTEEALTDQGLRNSSAKWVEPGALLIAMYGATAGAVARLAVRAATNQAVLAIVPNDVDESEYIGYALSAVVPSLLRRKQGSGQPNLNADMIRRVRIPWPHSVVRRNLERAMRSLDLTARHLQALASSKRAFKRGLMQQLLTGRRRFSGFESCTWDEVRLGDVFTERNETSRPDLLLLSVTADRGIIPRDELEKRDTSNPDKGKYKRVAIGDIAYNTMRMWQGVSGLSSTEGIVSPAYTVAVPTVRIDGRFAKHLFKFPPIVHLFHRYSQGLVDDTLNLKFDRFGKIRVRIPAEVEEQRRIAETLDLVDREITLLEALVEQTALQKGRLMQALLSGEIRVPEVGEATA